MKKRKFKSAEEIFITRFQEGDKNECWNWIGTIKSTGYGNFCFKRKHHLAHRFSFYFYNGFIDKKLAIDHVCRNRKCVNPKHLEQVSLGENCLRGNGVMALNKRKTHCPNGHEYSENNLFRYKDGKKWRRCLICYKNRNKKLFA